MVGKARFSQLECNLEELAEAIEIISSAMITVAEIQKKANNQLTIFLSSFHRNTTAIEEKKEPEQISGFPLYSYSFYA